MIFNDKISPNFQFDDENDEKYPLFDSQNLGLDMDNDGIIDMSNPDDHPDWAKEIHDKHGMTFGQPNRTLASYDSGKTITDESDSNVQEPETKKPDLIESFNKLKELRSNRTPAIQNNRSPAINPIDNSSVIPGMSVKEANDLFIKSGLKTNLDVQKETLQNQLDDMRNDPMHFRMGKDARGFDVEEHSSQYDDITRRIKELDQIRTTVGKSGDLLRISPEYDSLRKIEDALQENTKKWGAEWNKERSDLMVKKAQEINRLKSLLQPKTDKDILLPTITVNPEDESNSSRLQNNIQKDIFDQVSPGDKISAFSRGAKAVTTEMPSKQQVAAQKQKQIKAEHDEEDSFKAESEKNAEEEFNANKRKEWEEKSEATKENLKAIQGDVGNLRILQMLMEGASEIGAGITGAVSGFKVEPVKSKMFEQLAQQKEQNWKDRVSIEQDDANSVYSNSLRDFAKPFAKKIGLNPASLENMSGKQIGMVLPQIKDMYDAQVKADAYKLQRQESRADRAQRQAELNEYKQRKLEADLENRANRRFDVNTKDEVSRIQGSDRALDVVESIRSGKLKGASNIREQLNNEVSQLLMPAGMRPSVTGLTRTQIDTFYGRFKDLVGKIKGGPTDTIPAAYIDQIEKEIRLLQSAYRKALGEKVQSLKQGSRDPFVQGIYEDRASTYLPEQQAAYSPGSVVNIKGKLYRVGPDGNNLEEL